jgi:hypothetical protein
MVSALGSRLDNFIIPQVWTLVKNNSRCRVILQNSHLESKLTYKTLILITFLLMARNLLAIQ